MLFLFKTFPGADGFNNYPRKPHSIPRVNRHKNENNIFVDPLGTHTGGYNSKNVKGTDSELNGKRSGQDGQCSIPKFNMRKELDDFLDDMARKNIEVECDQRRFNDLCVNQDTGVIDEKSIIEAKGALQGEGEGFYKNLSRPTNPDVKLDFQATNINGDEIFIDHKQMIDFNDLAK